jgi:hypothetical protein
VGVGVGAGITVSVALLLVALPALLPWWLTFVRVRQLSVPFFGFVVVSKIRDPTLACVMILYGCAKSVRQL